MPSAVWIVDTKKEHIAVGEARKLNIPVVAILDTNCDPDEVDYKIPGNDDAIRSVTLLTRVIADAVAEGLIARSGVATEGKGEKAAGEPLAEWERDLLEGEKKADEAAAAAEAARLPRPSGRRGAGRGRTRLRPPRLPAAEAPPPRPPPPRPRPPRPSRPDPSAALTAGAACTHQRLRRGEVRSRRSPVGQRKDSALRSMGAPVDLRSSRLRERFTDSWRTTPPPTSRSSVSSPAPA